MLTTLADYFDVSVDVLLGYEMTLKKKKDIVDRINMCIAEHRFKDAEAISKDALVRYPHEFSVIYASAMIYHVKALEKQNPEDAGMAIDLLTKSMDYLSQNKNPDINDFVIRSQIAYDYIIVDEKAALERFKEINFRGINDTIIALVYLQNAEVKQALNYSTNGLINHLSDLINSSTYMILSLSCLDVKKNYEAAVILADTILEVIEKFKTDEVGYFSKLEAFYCILKAYLYACVDDDEKMKSNVCIGKKIAKMFDEKGTNDITEHLRFCYVERDSYAAMDSIGESAVEGIEAVLRKQFTKVAGINKKALNNLISCWEENGE